MKVELMCPIMENNKEAEEWIESRHVHLFPTDGEGLRLIAEREDTTNKKQKDSDKRVGERLNDVSHWRSELQV